MSQFDQFINRLVKVNERSETIKIGNRDHNYIHVTISEDETVVNEIIKLHGDNVRVWLPGAMGTSDYRLDRLNVCIEKVGENYQITRIYFG